MEHDSGTATWLAQKSGPFCQSTCLAAAHISSELCEEMKASSTLSGAFISHYPAPVHARLCSPSAPASGGRINPRNILREEGIFLICLAIPDFQTGRGRGGCRLSTTISGRGEDAWHWESSGWDSLISPRALSVLEDHCFWHVSPAAEWEDLLGWNLGPRGTWKSYS